MRLADRVSAMPHLRMTGVSNAVAKWMAQNPGKLFTPFLVGDTTYAPPAYVTEGILRSLQTQAHKYCATAGEPRLLKILADDFARMGITGLDPEKNICLTHGTLEALSLSCLALLNPGDEAIIPEPFYFLYPYHVRAAMGVPHFVGAEPSNDFKLSPQALRNAINDRTRVLFLNTPLNPVGSYYSASELKALADILESYPQIFIICDEIYERFVLDGQHISLWTVAPELRDRILIFNSFSKPFGYSGLRMGWVAGPEEVIDAIKNLKAGFTWSSNTVGQAAVFTALSDQDKCEQEMEGLRTKLRSARQLMIDRLRFMGFEVPSAPAGIFLFPNIPDTLTIPTMAIEEKGQISRAEQFAYWLIPFGTTVAPGIDMGRTVASYFRTIYAMGEEQLNLGLDSLQRALASVK